MYNPRSGEATTQTNRRQRYYKKGNYWYYNTREGAPIGPFNHLMDAIAGCNDYLEYLKYAPSLADLVAQRQ